MVNTPFPLFSIPLKVWVISIQLYYICMQMDFLSHHESVVITLIKGTLEDLTRAVANKKK